MEKARGQADSARTVAMKAERVVAELEVGIPKAEMEVEAQQQKAADLERRLEQLESATKACFSQMHA